MPEALPQYLSVKEFHKRHPTFSEASLRNHIYMATPRRTASGVSSGNGFAMAIKRIGRRIYIDEAAFFRWIDEINSAPERKK